MQTARHVGLAQRGEEGTGPSHAGGPVWVTEWAQVTVSVGDTAEGGHGVCETQGTPRRRTWSGRAAAEIGWLGAEATGT